MSTYHRCAGPTILYMFLALLLVFGICPLVFAKSSPAGGSFLIVSDIHLNPMTGADADLVRELIAADPMQWEPLLARSRITGFSQYGNDTNWWLLRSALDQMRATLPHPAFILVTGDILAHRYPQTFQSIMGSMDRDQYREFVLKTVQFVALEIGKRFPDTKVLVTPGNNDEECGNYSIRAGGLFLHDTAGLVRKLAGGDDEFETSWKALGSYDILHPAIRGVHVISLNTIFFSNKYHAARFDQGCAPVDSTAAKDELAWLESRLSRAQQNHEKVWLMFHIPPGIDGYTTLQAYQALARAPATRLTEKTCASAVVPMWVPQWTSQFDSLLKKYEGTVLLSLSGHTHTDDFRVMKASGSTSSYVLISPAISPIYRQNPAFRTVTFAADGSLADSSVYYLTNLEFASNKTSGKWSREYTFSQQWKAPRIDATSLGALYDHILNNTGDREEWLKLYNTSSAAAVVPASGVPALYCAVEDMLPEDYSGCFCPAVLTSTSAAKH